MTAITVIVTLIDLLTFLGNGGWFQVNGGLARLAFKARCYTDLDSVFKIRHVSIIISISFIFVLNAPSFGTSML